jgi:hypothetical protein
MAYQIKNGNNGERFAKVEQEILGLFRIFIIHFEFIKFLE